MKSTCLVSMAMVLSALILAPGCGSEETRTVEWYLAPENKAALEAKVKECENNPGEKGSTPNCINALAAREQAATNEFLGDLSFGKVTEPQHGLRR